MSVHSWAVVGGADSAAILAADEHRDEYTIQLQVMEVDGANPVFLGFGEDAVTQEGLALLSIGHTARVLGPKARLAVYALSAADASGGIETYTSLEYRHTLNYPIWEKQPEQGNPPNMIHPSPVDDYDEVACDWDPFMMIFDMNVVANAGEIILYYTLTDIEVESIDINDAAVTVDGGTVSWAFVASLVQDTSYYIKVANDVLRNELGDAWPGITDKTTWNFSTKLLCD